MIEEQIKKANIQAMKDKDAVARAFYSVLMNKIMLEKINKREKGEDLTDADISNIIKKMIKELADEKEKYQKSNHTEEVEKLTREMKIPKTYLPKMMTEEEIKLVIDSLEDKSIPSVMKHFKANYAGKVDMSLVNKIARG